jgi:hypothetical protein
MFNNGMSRYLIDFFYFDKEHNLPTYFETLLFLLCFLLLVIVAFGARKNSTGLSSHWFFLAIIFFYFAADEILRLHEQSIAPLRNMFNTNDYFYLAWTIPAIIFCLILGIFYLKFLLKLKPLFRNLFVASGFIFISGAIVAEIFGSHHQFVYGKENFGYTMLTTLEESLEMTGLILFIYSLIRYIKFYHLRLSINFGGLTEKS